MAGLGFGRLGFSSLKPVEVGQPSSQASVRGPAVALLSRGMRGSGPVGSQAPTKHHDPHAHPPPLWLPHSRLVCA